MTFCRRLRSEWTLPPSIFLPSHFSLSRPRLISAKRRGKISVLQTWLTSCHHLWRRQWSDVPAAISFSRLVGCVEILWWPHQPLLRFPLSSASVPSLIRTKISLLDIYHGAPVHPHNHLSNRGIPCCWSNQVSEKRLLNTWLMIRCSEVRFDTF